MSNRAFLQRLAVQLGGHLVLGTLAWYWLGLGLGTTALVLANGGLLAALVLSSSLLAAAGLGQLRQWRWCLPAVLLSPLLLWHWWATLAVLLLWVIVLLPTGAAGRWCLLFRPAYLARAGAALLAMISLPWLLLNWIPAVTGLTLELASFGLRVGGAYLIAVTAWTLLLWHVSQSVTSSRPESLP